MGFNLGQFAGGFVKGAQTQQELQQRGEEAKSQADFRSRQMKMMEANEKAAADQRGRTEALRAEAGDFTKSWYGPQKVQDGYTESSDEKGGVVRVPKYKDMPAMKPGEDAARDAGYASHMAFLQMKHTGDFAQLAPVMKYVEEVRGTEYGKKLLAATSGDKDAMNWIVTEAKGDPAKANFFNKNGETWMDLGTGGKPQKVTEMALLGGANKLFDHLQSLRKGDQEGELTKAKIGAYEASAAENRADASYKGTQRTSALEDDRQKKIDRHVTGHLDIDPVTKKPDPNQYSYITRRVAAAKDTQLPEAAAQAKDEYMTVAGRTKSILANPQARAAAAAELKMDPKDPALTNALMKYGLSKYLQPRTGNVGAP